MAKVLLINGSLKENDSNKQIQIGYDKKDYLWCCYGTVITDKLL